MPFAASGVRRLKGFFPDICPPPIHAPTRRAPQHVLSSRPRRGETGKPLSGNMTRGRGGGGGGGALVKLGAQSANNLSRLSLSEWPRRAAAALPSFLALAPPSSFTTYKRSKKTC